MEIAIERGQIHIILSIPLLFEYEAILNRKKTEIELIRTV